MHEVIITLFGFGLHVKRIDAADDGKVRYLTYSVTERKLVEN